MNAVQIRYYLFIIPAILSFLIFGILFLIVNISIIFLSVLQIALIKVMFFFNWLATGNESNIKTLLEKKVRK